MGEKKWERNKGGKLKNAFLGYDYDGLCYSCLLFLFLFLPSPDATLFAGGKMNLKGVGKDQIHELIRKNILMNHDQIGRNNLFRI